MKNKNDTLISIKKRLIVSIISLTTILILISWAFIVNEAKHEVKEVYDARLGQSAKILALAMPGILTMPVEEREHLYEYWFNEIQNTAENDDSETDFGHPYEANLIFQFYQDNNLIFKSPNAPDSVSTNINDSGYSEFTLNNEIWHSFVLEIPNKINQDLYLLVAEKHSIRNEAIIEIAFSTSLPQLLLIPSLALITLFLVNKFLHPIIELREAVALRSINNLKPIVMERSVVELQPLVQQLNYLLDQLNNAWDREKRFTSTAAHELKTPLAILRLNAENALETNDIKERHNDLNNIIIGIDRTDRLIQQLLMYSRIQAKHSLESTPTNITHVLREVIAQLVPLAMQQKQNISFIPIEHCTISGNTTLLAILFSNIIDNSIRYSGFGSEMTIKMQHGKDDVNEEMLLISITDNGEKIDDNIRERIFEKFFRADSGKGDGAGLGMAIANDIAEHHNGKVKLQTYNKADGNVFVISLPMQQNIIST
ncbi:MAG: ATP-binding protein [Psychromonas sp.]